MQRNRKRYTRLCSIVLVAALVFAALPVTAFTANAEAVLNCRHEHDDSCYEENTAATGSEAKKLVCRHEHDENCYEEAGFDGTEPVASPSDAQPELFGMLPAMTGADALVNDINTWADGNGIEARTDGDGDKVIITGKAVSDTSLKLVIPMNVTVEWKAVLTGSGQYVVRIANTSEENSVFHMAGGAITSVSTLDESAAIFNNNEDTDIFVSGGSITGGDNSEFGNTSFGIRNYADNSITISGGMISSGSGNGNYGLSNLLGTVKVKGGIITGGNGINCGLYCNRSRVEMSGGTITGGSDEDSLGIDNFGSSLFISGGRIINPKGYAIGSIYVRNADTSVIKISGSGVVFGKDPDELGSTIAQEEGDIVQPTLEGNAAVITWTASQAEYDSGSLEDLAVSPAAVKASWSTKDGKGGVSYEAGANKGFIEVPGVTVTAAVRTLASIAVTTEPIKTVYTEGESFDSTGMVVTATYADGSAEDVKGYTVSPSAALTAKEASVTVAYTEGDVTKTAVQAITVNAAARYTVSFHANGGSVTPASEITGSDGKLTALPTPTHSGDYRFDGWFTAENGGVRVTTDTVFTQDSTIYAHWTYTGDSGSTGGDSGSTGGGSGNTGGGSGSTGGGSGSTGGGSGSTGGGSGSTGGGSGSTGGGSGSTGGGSGSAGGGSGSTGGGSGSAGGPASASGSLKESLPENYVGETKIINNVRVPSYVEEVIWKAMEDGRWRLGRADGSDYVNTWVAAYNPYADLSAGQQAFDWFLFDRDGYMVTGWYTDGTGGTYYLNPLSDNTKGRMMTGWLLINGKYYYFNEEPDGTRGKMYRNTMTPDGCYVDENGEWDGKER